MIYIHTTFLLLWASIHPYFNLYYVHTYNFAQYMHTTSSSTYIQLHPIHKINKWSLISTNETIGDIFYIIQTQLKHNKSIKIMRMFEKFLEMSRILKWFFFNNRWFQASSSILGNVCLKNYFSLIRITQQEILRRGVLYYNFNKNLNLKIWFPET